MNNEVEICKRFNLGDIHIAASIVKIFNDDLTQIVTLLERHELGDWGDIARSDKQINEAHLGSGRPILSVYVVHGYKVWIVTNLKNKETWCCLPKDMRNKDESKEFGPRITGKAN